MDNRILNHGFTLEYEQELPEIKAVLYRMRYDKNGASLIWLDRKEENKTFAVSFKTLSKDDTGVFHILEHSLLCGSEHYPVSKPFVEMIKSSLQTFMNAFTFPDKTVYPLCSRNHQDFLNLMDVYLDAVFHPLCVTQKEIFAQEGWHYELESPEGELSYNGVVYNEMKGVFASPDTIIDNTMRQLLFPDNCYRFQSGGDPEHITELTYEEYKASYRKFYHPSNACIILDGEMEIDVVLEKIGKVLSEYEKIDDIQKIETQKPVRPEEYTGFYEIGENEEITNKTILAGGWVYGRFDEPEKNMACSVLVDALCSSNESPLKKAILEKGYAENVEFFKTDGIKQPYMSLVIRNTSEERKEEIWQIIWDTLRELVAKGMDHKRLEAILSRMEFQMREKETGMYPQGIINALNVLDSYLYGGNPEQNLCYNQIFSNLRAKIGYGYFERLLKEIVIENPHHAKIVLRPSKTLGRERQERERQVLQGMKAKWTMRKKKQIIEELAHLREVQGRKETKEQLAVLPTLALSDIPETIAEVPQTITEMNGRKVLLQKLETEGITHITYYFQLSDMTLEELGEISFLRVLLGQTATEHYSALELQAELERHLGRFQVSVDVISENGQTKKCIPYLTIHVSVLEEKLEEAIRLIGEILNGSRFTDVLYIRNRIRQLRISLEQSVMMNGDQYASRRVLAGFSAKGAVQETVQGITMLWLLQKMDGDFEQEGEKRIKNLECLFDRIFVRERATISVTGKIENTELKKLFNLLKEGQEQIGAPINYHVFPVEKKGILIPAEIGFAGKGGNLNQCGEGYHGAMKVAARILSYGYLWNTIRVKGGAYGTRLVISRDGDVVFTSFRDPGAGNSLAGFDGAGKALRSICDSEESLDKYIISTIASMEPLLSVRQRGIRVAEESLGGITSEMRRKERREILHTSKEELVEVGLMLDFICKNAGECIVGGKCQMDSVDF